MRRAAFAVILYAVLSLVVSVAPARAADRVPRPEMESGYVIPDLQIPSARSEALEWIDVAVLAAALAAAAWLGLPARSREGLFVLGLFSVAYFGFYRRGCICAVGSLQNIVLAASDPAYTVPAAAVAFFALPVAATLFFGRGFCAGVCPLGAIQDLVVLKPLRLPRWLSAPLSLVPGIYLAFAVFFAATGAGFVICRYDPFVSFFRMGGEAPLLILGAGILLLGTVVARPYCRFLCPYGFILRWLSRLSRRHVTVTPTTCVQCRLCEHACPFDAIRPAAEATGADPSRAPRGLGMALALLPLLVGAGGLAGWIAAPVLAQAHPQVRLERQLARERAGLAEQTTLESDAFRSSRTPLADLQAETEGIMRRFRIASPLLGASIALVFGMFVAGSFMRRRRTDWEPDRGECFSCGRCFSYCPQEHERLKAREAGQAAAAVKQAAAAVNPTAAATRVAPVAEDAAGQQR